MVDLCVELRVRMLNVALRVQLILPHPCSVTPNLHQVPHRLSGLDGNRARCARVHRGTIRYLNVHLKNPISQPVTHPRPMKLPKPTA